jgi:hypothetical protein
MGNDVDSAGSDPDLHPFKLEFQAQRIREKFKVLFDYQLAAGE